MIRLFLIMFFSLVTVSAYAQLDVKKVDDYKSEKIMTFNPEWAWLYENSDGYYLAAKSQNQFDSWVWLFLGDDKESALLTLQDLQAIIKDQKEYVHVNSKGKNIILSYTTFLGSKQIWMKMDGNCDYAPVTLSALKKAVKYLEKL